MEENDWKIGDVVPVNLYPHYLGEDYVMQRKHRANFINCDYVKEVASIAG